MKRGECLRRSAMGCTPYPYQKEREPAALSESTSWSLRIVRCSNDPTARVERVWSVDGEGAT